ncbi:MAG TPA: PHB depolymerase family esterase [Kofleriaceae bacterium]|nr:PHB depolymerase family esterase [Kofleriaceae bacterium]
MWRAVVVVLLAARVAHAGPPCARCVVALPAGDDPVPLVVVLHGDREHAPAAAARWRARVARRGWALLALECPHDLGCGDSFWKWDGDPAWVVAQVAAIARQRAIDPARIYLVGWSGGASYIGWRAQAWPATFAAVVFHGGGMAPGDDACPERALPAYFLVGDKNPLHGLARALRGYFDGCKQDVVWDVIAGADHAKEEAALTARKADTILDWLAARHR